MPFLLSLLLSTVANAAINQARLELCNAKFKDLAKGYFVMDQKTMCSKYAAVEVSEKEKDCVEAAIGSTPNGRDYFFNYETMAELCKKNPNITPEHKKCIFQKTKINGNAGGAFGHCHPEINKCMGELNRRKSAKNNKKLNSFYFSICQSDPDDLDLGNCAIDFIQKEKDLIGNVSIVKQLCHKKYRACVDTLDAKVTGNSKVNQYRTIAHVCQYIDTENESMDYAKCYLEQDQDGIINHPKDRQQFCKLEEGPQKECLLNLSRKKVDFEEGHKVCVMTDNRSRECMMNYWTKSAPFSKAPLDTLSKEAALSYCRIDEADVQKCANEKLNTLSDLTIESVENVVTNCRKGSFGYKQCIIDFKEFFEIGYTLNVPNSMGEKICEINSHDMRVCMLNAAMAKDKYKLLKGKPSGFSFGFSSSEGEDNIFPFKEAYQHCLNEYLGGAIQEFTTDNSWECRYNYFYQFSEIDKSWHCIAAAGPTKRLCNQYYKEIYSMKPTDLRPICRQFYINMSPEEISGNKLYFLCRKYQLLRK